MKWNASLIKEGLCDRSSPVPRCQLLAVEEQTPRGLGDVRLAVVHDVDVLVIADERQKPLAQHRARRRQTLETRG